MDPILFYGVPQGCSFGSIVALEWLQQPYRLCRIQMPEQVQGERFARINPLRETPSMRLPDGRIISQSMAILSHIAHRGLDKGLGFPQDGSQQDRLNEMLAFLNTTFFAAFSPLWLAYEQELQPTEKEVLRTIGRQQVRKAHEQLELLLDGRDWLVGASRTVADAYLSGIARWNNYHQVLDASSYPNLARLLRRLDDDPAVNFARAIEAQRNAESAGGFRGHVTLESL